ncbi:uncharacterized protein LOC129584484 [Paramacrobiotus metropolitanus]|uniref:uncharacterized protein LOC129584484 n=1 Tax=Paramacrobiotus metropolitanus TaxID=2943436 RepID=UPI0024465786|nr:uncharacterized protein LOC129584484 [Paramacrobiotus metropolitanus]
MPLKASFPLLLVFLYVQNIGCASLTEQTTVALAPVSDAAATSIPAVNNPVEPAANVEAASVIVNNGTAPEVVQAAAVDGGNISSNARMALPVATSFRCFKCKIVDDEKQQCNDTIDCSFHGDRCHFIQGLVKIDQENATKITVAGCGHAGHVSVTIHHHDITIDGVHHPADGCSLLAISAEKSPKQNDVGNSTVLFEGSSCTCNSTLCNHADILRTVATDVSPNTQKNQSSSSYRTLPAGWSVAVLLLVTYLIPMADCIARYGSTV